MPLWLRALKLADERLRTVEPWGNDGAIDSMFYAVALRNVIRAVGMARPSAPCAIDDALAHFDAAVPNGVKMRDMLEHFDDYETGKGKLQKARNIGGYEVTFKRAYHPEPGGIITVEGSLAGGAIQVTFELDTRVATPAATTLVKTVFEAAKDRL